jgi:tight adherence protein C
MRVRDDPQDRECKSLSALVVIAPVMLGIAIAVGFWQFIPEPTQTEELHDRLARVQAATMQTDDVDEIELQKPFAERIFFPLVNSLGQIMARRTKESQLASLRIKLAKAGSQQRPETILALQVVCPIVLGAIAVLVCISMHWGSPLNIGVPVGLVALGFFYPTSALQGKTKKRTVEIRLQLPGSLDLLCVAMEAGLSLDAALMRVVEGPEGVLNQEFGKVLNEIHLGRPRSEALMALAERNDVPELENLVRSLVQAEPLGVSLATVLTVQADEIRRLRRQRAEEAGHRAPVLMLLPMMGCIFPCIFVILLGPALIKVFNH